MSDDPNYSKRELDLKFEGLEHRLFNEEEGFLPRLLVQTTKTNGRVSRLERAMLIVACIVGTLLFTSGSELLKFVMSII